MPKSNIFDELRDPTDIRKIVLEFMFGNELLLVNNLPFPHLKTLMEIFFRHNPEVRLQEYYGKAIEQIDDEKEPQPEKFGLWKYLLLCDTPEAALNNFLSHTLEMDLNDCSYQSFESYYKEQIWESLSSALQESDYSPNLGKSLKKKIEIAFWKKYIFNEQLYNVLNKSRKKSIASPQTSSSKNKLIRALSCHKFTADKVFKHGPWFTKSTEQWMLGAYELEVTLIGIASIRKIRKLNGYRFDQTQYAVQQITIFLNNNYIASRLTFTTKKALIYGFLNNVKILFNKQHAFSNILDLEKLSESEFLAIAASSFSFSEAIIEAIRNNHPFILNKFSDDSYVVFAKQDIDAAEAILNSDGVKKSVKFSEEQLIELSESTSCETLLQLVKYNELYIQDKQILSDDSLILIANKLSFEKLASAIEPNSIFMDRMSPRMWIKLGNGNYSLGIEILKLPTIVNQLINSDILFQLEVIHSPKGLYNLFLSGCLPQLISGQLSQVCNIFSQLSAFPFSMLKVQPVHQHLPTNEIEDHNALNIFLSGLIIELKQRLTEAVQKQDTRILSMFASDIYVDLVKQNAIAATTILNSKSVKENVRFSQVQLIEMFNYVTDKELANLLKHNEIFIGDEEQFSDDSLICIAQRLQLVSLTELTKSSTVFMRRMTPTMWVELGNKCPSLGLEMIGFPSIANQIIKSDLMFEFDAIKYPDGIEKLFISGSINLLTLDQLQELGLRLRRSVDLTNCDEKVIELNVKIELLVKKQKFIDVHAELKKRFNDKTKQSKLSSEPSPSITNSSSHQINIQNQISASKPSHPIGSKSSLKPFINNYCTIGTLTSISVACITIAAVSILSLSLSISMPLTITLFAAGGACLLLSFAIGCGSYRSRNSVPKLSNLQYMFMSISRSRYVDPVRIHRKSCVLA